MFKVIVTAGLVALGLTRSVAGESAEPSSEAAVQLARTTLARQLSLAPEVLGMESVEPHTWNDSSLGCADKRSVALQVITEGYIVKLTHEGRNYRVHVAGDAAIVCDRPSLKSGAVRQGMRATGVDTAVRLSREDLAQRLGVDPKSIRLGNVRPKRWPDSALGCPRAGEAVVAVEVNGFRVDLISNGRVYPYHADQTQARACPPIESQ